jgi:hypothetical protein
MLDSVAIAIDRRMMAGAIAGVLIAASDGIPLAENPMSRGL